MTAVLDRAFEALANPHRREIVDRLADGPLTTPELGRAFDMSKQALSRHVHVLESAGFVTRRPHGRVHELRLEPQPLDDIAAWTDLRRAAWERNLDRLDAVLTDTADPNQETDR
ncbi:MAG: metalloregulator ArsR/SmtB family transcription factor [Actinomycetota bacterium]